MKFLRAFLVVIIIVTYSGFSNAGNFDNKSVRGAYTIFNMPGKTPAAGNESVINQVQSCNAAGKKVDSLMAIYENDTVYYKFTYNNSGYVSTYISGHLINKTIKTEMRGEYEYYPYGAISMETVYDFTDSTGSQNKRSVFLNNTDKLNQWTITYTYSAGQWVYNQRTSLSYDSKGRTTAQLIEKWIAGSWVNYSKLEYVYKSAGSIPDKFSYYWNNNTWQIRNSSVYDFDNRGNNILITATSYYDGEVINYSTDSMAYNAMNYLINTYKKIRIDSDMVNSERYTFEYDANGNRTSYFYQMWSDTTWRNSLLTKSAYTSNNLLSEYTVYSWRNDAWVEVSRETNTYNTTGKLVTNVYYLNRDAGETPLYKASYKYDSSDTLLTNFHLDSWTVDYISVGAWYTLLNIDNNWLNKFSVLGYDIFLTYSQGTIPVELTSFTGEYKNNSIMLNWKTATEINNSGFAVEKKSSSADWQNIGFVKGNGTVVSLSSYSFVDAAPAAEAYYRLKQIDYNGTYKYSPEIKISASGITQFSLAQNYPNPFNPVTIIRYSLPVEGKVSLVVFNSLGQTVSSLVNATKPAGTYQVMFDGSALPSGVYFYSLNSGGFSQTRKLLLLK